jgi:drug/metabolite transporter (DMT)-like permease
MDDLNVHAYIGHIASLIAALCWAICSLCFTSAGHRIGALAVGFIRLMMALLMFIIYGWVTRGMPFPTDASAHAWFYLSLSGLIGFFLGDIFLFRSFVLIGPRLTLLVMSLWPAMTAVMGVAVLGEKLSYNEWCGIMLTLCGIIWVVLERQMTGNNVTYHATPLGILFAVLGAFGQAAGYILSKIGMSVVDPVTGTVTNYDPFAASQIRAVAALGGFILLFTLLKRWGRIRSAVVQAKPMAVLSLGALTGPFIGVGLSLLAIQYIPTGISATIMATTPIIIIPLVILLHKEHVSTRAIFGAVVAVIGVAILFLS